MSDESSTPPPMIAELSRDPAVVPLAYGYLRLAPAPREIRRASDSDWHRARAYACSSFHKSISRCLRPEG